MSRIGNKPIDIPSGVKIDITSNRVTVKGKLGELSQTYPSNLSVNLKSDGSSLIVKRNSEDKDTKSKHGLCRSLFNNMVVGVVEGFTKELELVGVGYRVAVQGQKLDLALGFSHNILFELPVEVKAEATIEKGKNPLLKLTSYDKQLLGQVVAKIRSFRKIEPYKGKGIKFVGEVIRRKDGKSA